MRLSAALLVGFERNCCKDVSELYQRNAGELDRTRGVKARLLGDSRGRRLRKLLLHYGDWRPVIEQDELASVRH